MQKPKFIFFILFMLMSSLAQSYTVILDPGHGGIDKGANRGPIKESDLVLKIAQEVSRQIKILNISNLDFFLTRDKDLGLPLEKRVRISHERQADLFISLHANSSTSKEVSGMEFYFSERDPQIDSSLPIPEQILTDLSHTGKITHSLNFAKILQDNLTNQNPTTRSVIRRAPFRVVEKSAIPSVLVEVGFLSNSKEVALLNTRDYQQQIAQTLVKAILDFKETSDKTTNFIQQ